MTFWDVQVNAIKCLALTGLKFQLHDRIPIFKTWIYLRNLEIKLTKDKSPEDTATITATIDAARDSLQGLLYFRNQGIEPQHKGNMYVKDAS